ncbi:hypothetical protein JTE90_024000 [Oedothorax gibbosus]|uniref:Uncharacterized protein n=1 Tax=Oedothorax gibbosus TaxID=931172 RepID=A0AAV6TIP1_9ARAC|nr:hypothetical protein JTE90_024000 [Oedothorax gibbosus]
MKVRARRRSAAFRDPRSLAGGGAPETRRVPLVEVAEFERTRRDPKDGELCPGQDEARGTWGGPYPV